MKALQAEDTVRNGAVGAAFGADAQVRRHTSA